MSLCLKLLIKPFTLPPTLYLNFCIYYFWCQISLCAFLALGSKMFHITRMLFNACFFQNLAESICWYSWCKNIATRANFQSKLCLKCYRKNFLNRIWIPDNLPGINVHTSWWNWYILKLLLVECKESTKCVVKKKHLSKSCSWLLPLSISNPSLRALNYNK